MAKKFFNRDLETTGSIKAGGNIDVTGNLEVAGNLVGGATTNIALAKVSSATDLTLTCDSDGDETTSKIKFCKDSNDTVVASIDQDGDLEINGSFGTSAGNIVLGTGNITTTSGKVNAPALSSSADLILTCDSGDSTQGNDSYKIKFCKDSTSVAVTTIDQYGNLTASGQVTAVKAHLPIIRSISDLTLTCDSDDASESDTTSKIKFCKDDTDTEVASIDQEGNFLSPAGDVVLYTGSVATNSGDVSTTSGKIKAPTLVAQHNLVIGWDAADTDGSVTDKKLKFCKNASQTEIGSIDQAGNLELVGGVHCNTGNMDYYSYIEASTGNFIANGSGDFQTNTGNFTTATGKVNAPAISSPTDLTITCDSDDSSNADTSSKIKFCKNSSNTELATLEQDGDLRLKLGDLYIPPVKGVVTNKLEFTSSTANDPAKGTHSYFIGDPTTGNLDVYLKDAASGGTGNADRSLVIHGWNPNHNGGSGGYLPRFRFDQDGDLYLYGIATDDSNGIDSHHLGLRDDNNDPSSQSRVYRAGTHFFSGGHVYPLASDLPVGTAVELVDGILRASSTANSAVCVGIIALTKDLSPEDVTQEDSFGSTLTSGWVAKVVSLGDTRHKACTGFRVCNEAGDIDPGDLLVTSSTTGYLMKQADDIIRSKTVGKAMEAVTFDSSGQAEGVYGYIYCG